MRKKIWPWVVGGILGLLVISYGIFLYNYVNTPTNDSTESKYQSVSTSKPSSNSYKTPAKGADICIEPECTRKKMDGGQYCAEHTCHYKGCRNRKQNTNIFCRLHDDTRPSRNSGPKKLDPYDIKDYDDVDDFYDDYYYDFEDFDEAEMYWDDHH